ncbi:thioesterase superfamily protein [Pseudopedobacter saltans DSM 12145]|uniref:Thioesterase superfamily protein n=1 Tax=Pseudopedobacter saltans (strain ATCC 51119 / DSM 12145 / JCM 21818 / CCUG 39354 / LMG 10337 / NBRC 100064 / NCIMB 13643) TaxID=762903 RepID=F0S8X6_PSESL|nr:hotdog fold thioesterase [Pseudopedobacter saltans]ADY53463.1 thioesterase superfamily protein [Pseudopedobacter saltans DSM 12145]
MIWFKDYTVEEINERSIYLAKLLGITYTEIGENYLKATMPVDERTKQPAGILHGGASVVLAESIGSIASNLIVDSQKFMGVGLEINANHLRPVTSGNVTAMCTPMHIGNKTHVWDIRLFNDQGKMTCVSRLTVAIVPKMENN